MTRKVLKFKDFKPISKFLRNFLKRNWKYYYDKKGDCHYFELIENPWGEWNEKKLKFCLQDKLNFF